MVLAKLKDLHQFLKAANLVHQSKLDSWVESFKLVPNSKNLGWGHRICVCEYKAVFVLEGFKKAPELPLVLVSTWLLQNDPTRLEKKLAAPDVEIDMADDDTADITIEVMFREDIELVEDVAGAIQYNGKAWNIQGVAVTEAETGVLYANDDGLPITEADMPDGALVDEDEEFVLIIEDNS